MRSGLLLSSVITIWIVATIVAISLLLPDIKTTIKTAQSISSDSSLTIDGGMTDSSMDTNEALTTYTPLGILDIIAL